MTEPTAVSLGLISQIDITSPVSSNGDVFAAALEKALPVEAGASSSAPIHASAMNQASMNAADDAWISVVALTEQLQKRDLSPEKKGVLLNDLAASWQSFRERSDPIARQVEGLIAHKS